MNIVEGDFLRDPIPGGHDALIAANVVHVFDPQQNVESFGRVRASAVPKARLLLVDFWTNPEHTEPLFAALMAGEFLAVGGNGDVYSVDEVKAWFDQTGWSFLEHRPLPGRPASL